MPDFVSTSTYMHDEFARRHVNPPEPLEQPRHGLRETIGHTLILLGERMARVESSSVERAA